MRFTLTASRAPAANLTVNVSVTQAGSFLAGPRPLMTLTRITIAARTTTTDLVLQTEDDTVDEANGAILAEVFAGIGYNAGSPSSASVTVNDNDRPPVPANLRANGNLVDVSGTPHVTLRWDPVPRATGYKVRYVEEDCDSSGRCAPNGGLNRPNWQTLPSLLMPSGSTVEEAALALVGLTENEKRLYLVEVQAVIVEASGWSDFALVFPTASPLGHGTDVATAPFHGYQAKNAQGSHEFSYVLCTETIPAGLTMTAQDMKDAVDEWEDTVTWNRGGVNIITTTDYALSASEHCSTWPVPPRGRFEVKFVSGHTMKNACTNPLPWVDDAPPPACWRSHSWSTIGVDRITSGAVLLNIDRGSAFWNKTVTGGCKKLYEQVVHEGGHAFGIGNRTGVDFNRHPINTEYAIMSYANVGKYCKPQAYDIVSVVALYQSR